MKEYDVVAIGSGSAMNIPSAMIQSDPNIKVAMIDKDEPDGICLTKRCIPSKILLHPVHLAKSAMSEWDFMWDPKTVEAVTSDRAYSIEKARSELGYVPTYTLEDGLRDTVQWYRQNRIIQ